MPSAYMAVSETRATSALSLAGFSGDIFRDGRAADFLFAFDEERMLTGSVPVAVLRASMALMWEYIWPLSSAVPRP